MKMRVIFALLTIETYFTIHCLQLTPGKRFLLYVLNVLYGSNNSATNDTHFGKSFVAGQLYFKLVPMSIIFAE